MAAYVVVIELADESSYAEQRDRLAQKIEAQGGRYLVRGTPSEIAEGNLEPRRVAVIEYESVEGRARRSPLQNILNSGRFVPSQTPLSVWYSSRASNRLSITQIAD